MLLGADRLSLTIGSQRTIVRNQSTTEAACKLNLVQISAVVFVLNTKRRQVEVFSTTIVDIEKALVVKEETDPRTKLPPYYFEFLKVFDRIEAEKLLPLRGPRVDYTIKLERVDRKEPAMPWGPLYSISRDELIVLRKSLTSLLNK